MFNCLGQTSAIEEQLQDSGPAKVGGSEYIRNKLRRREMRKLKHKIMGVYSHYLMFEYTPVRIFALSRLYEQTRSRSGLRPTKD